MLFCFGVHESVFLGWWVIPCLSVAIISGALLMRFDGKHDQPFFGRGIFPSPAAAYRSLGASFMLGATFLSFVFICTLGLSEVLKWNVRETGLLLFPYSIGSALVSKFMLPGMFRKLGARRVTLVAMLCLFAGALLLAAGIYMRVLSWFLTAILLVNSFAIAIGYPAFTVLSLSGVIASRQGIAAGVQSAIYSVGTGVGLSVVGLSLQLFARDTTATQLTLTCGMIALCCMVAVALLLSGVDPATGLRPAKDPAGGSGKV